MSGLGGQGVITAANILGSAAILDGYKSTVNPFFGAEKRLAPAASYVRISTEKIFERGEVLSPNLIVIFHPHVITMGKCYTMPFFDGIKKDGTIVINSEGVMELRDEELKKLSEFEGAVYMYVTAKVDS